MMKGRNRKRKIYVEIARRPLETRFEPTMKKPAEKIGKDRKRNWNCTVVAGLKDRNKKIKTAKCGKVATER